MGTGKVLSTTCVLQAFSQEVASHHGTVSDTYHDGERLFVRSVLPDFQEVKRNDRLRAGVALKCCDSELSIHPYVLRLVCKNGAIMSHSIATRRLTITYEWEPEEALAELREAVCACCAPEIFSASVDQIRSTQSAQVDLALNLLPMLNRMPGGAGSATVAKIMERFFEDGDRTRFALMNAVTSVARDTTDPEVRWNLEELGGGIAIDAPGRVPKTPLRRAARRDKLEMAS